MTFRYVLYQQESRTCPYMKDVLLAWNRHAPVLKVCHQQAARSTKDPCRYRQSFMGSPPKMMHPIFRPRKHTMSSPNAIIEEMMEQAKNGQGHVTSGL